MGKVTCRSMSSTENAGSITLICTCLFVISGTASIGSCHNDRAPTRASTNVATTTSTRLRIED